MIVTHTHPQTNVLGLGLHIFNFFSVCLDQVHGRKQLQYMIRLKLCKSMLSVFHSYTPKQNILYSITKSSWPGSQHASTRENTSHESCLLMLLSGTILTFICNWTNGNLAAWANNVQQIYRFVSACIVLHIYIYTILCIVRLKALISYHENMPWVFAVTKTASSMLHILVLDILLADSCIHKCKSHMCITNKYGRVSHNYIYI